MHWSKLFIPTLREDPSESHGAAHALLIRAGYMRGRDYLPLGRLALRKIVELIRREMDAAAGQEMLLAGPVRAIAAELRSYRQLPQIWYEFAGLGVKSYSFDLHSDGFERMCAVLRRILEACQVSEPSDGPDPPFPDPEGDLSLEEFHTPGQKTIADVSRFTGLPETSQMKSLVVVADGEPVLALVRGDHQLDQENLAWHLGAREIRPARVDEIGEWFGAEPGSLGPVGVKLRVAADEALRRRKNMICGANRNDYHLRHVTPGKDFLPEFYPIRSRNEAPLLRTRTTKSPLHVSDETAQLVPMSEGAGEIFLDRILETAADRYRDADGLVLPPSSAPFAAVITPVNIADEPQRRAAFELHDRAPFDALLDDRDERPGVKFKDADLIGIPYRITLGKKLAQGMVEIRERRAKISQDVPVPEALAFVAARMA